MDVHVILAQQTMAHYQGGTLRISIALLTQLITTFHTSFDALVNDTPLPAKKKPGPASKLEQQMHSVKQLPRTKQKMITEMLDALIHQQAS